MLTTVIVLCVPTMVLLALLALLHQNRLPSGFIWVGIGFGMIVAPAPAWFIETPVDNLAEKVTNVYLRLFLQNVIGAAVVEELLIGLGVITVCFLFREVGQDRRNILAAAVAVAIGFTTTENVMAAYSAENPLSAALDRLMTIPFGHVSLQLVMGYFAANVILDQRRRLVNGLLMFLLPMAIHGWGDYAESLFRYQADLTPDSLRTEHLFSCWILALAMYVTGAAIAIWQTYKSRLEPENSM